MSTSLVVLLRGLPADDWSRPTVAGAWVVRDVVAHLVDLTLRRLSFHRDAMVPPPPARAINSARDFVEFINSINAEWVGAARRFSPQVLTDLFELASQDLADWFENLPLDAPALFGVSWAGEQVSEGWFDVGREFTELWHHQEQIRLAVNAPSLEDPKYLAAVIEIAVRGLPHAFHDVPAAAAESMVLDVTGPAGGQWTLIHDGARWGLQSGAADQAATRVSLPDVAAWRLLFNALPASAASEMMHVEGKQEFAEALARARSVIV